MIKRRTRYLLAGAAALLVILFICALWYRSHGHVDPQTDIVGTSQIHSQEELEAAAEAVRDFFETSGSYGGCTLKRLVYTDCEDGEDCIEFEAYFHAGWLIPEPYATYEPGDNTSESFVLKRSSEDGGWRIEAYGEGV